MKAITEYLNQNETIIWQGRPDFFVWALKKILIPSAILIPITTAIIIGLINQAFVLLVFAPFFLFFDFFLFWEYLLVFSGKGYPTYYITSQKRIIILAELGGLNSTFMPYEGVFSYENIRSTVMKQTMLERLFGTNCKTIFFHLGFQPIIKQTLVQPGLNIDTNPQFGFTLATDLDLQTQTIAFAQGGSKAQKISFDSVESPEFILSFLTGEIPQPNFSAGVEVKSSLKGLLLYGLIKDFVRLLKSVLYTSIVIMVLGLIIYAQAPHSIFIKIVDYYLPRSLLLSSIIFLVGTSVPRVVLGLISPLYKIVDNFLIIKQRRFKIISDPIQEEIDLSRIKRIWRIRNFIDSSETSSFLLAIQLTDIYLGQNNFKTKTNFISKLLKMSSGALTYRVLCSIPNEDAFIKQLGDIEIIEDFDGNIFEKFIFYSFFI